MCRVKTEVLSVFNNDENYIIEKASGLLKNGELVAIPTETVYGLGGNVYDENALKNIYKVKGRPGDNPMIVHISEFSEIYPLVEEVPKKVRAITKKFWPGPLTVILKKSEKVPFTATGGLNTVAIRVPDCEITRKIIKNSGPIAAPSANLSGSPSPTTATHVFEDLSEKIPLIIDAGNCRVGVESTVISFASDVPVILRPGFITKEDIEGLIGEVKIHSAVVRELESDEQATSPGMKYKHYAPETKIVLLDCDSKDFVKFINLNSTENIGAICFDEEKNKIFAPTLSLGKQACKAEHLYNLYKKLRETDLLNADVVYARLPDKSGIDLAFYNRIIRAAGHQIQNPKQPLIIGLTGASGVGKTDISKLFEKSGYFVIDADKCAREVMKSSKILNCLAESFGASVLNKDGTLDRKSLAEKAFSCKEKTERLNKITHPAISKYIIDEINRSGFKKILLDAPLLIEAGLDSVCDEIIGVVADEKKRIDRLKKRDGLSEDLIKIRLKAGKNNDYYKKNCGIIIDNSFNFEDTALKISDIISKVEERGKI